MSSLSFFPLNICKKSLKIPKGQSESVYHRQHKVTCISIQILYLVLNCLWLTAFSKTLNTNLSPVQRISCWMKMFWNNIEIHCTQSNTYTERSILQKATFLCNTCTIKNTILCISIWDIIWLLRYKQWSKEFRNFQLSLYISYKNYNFAKN